MSFIAQEASSDGSSAAQMAIDRAMNVRTILERQILVAESAYRSMILAADGYKVFVTAVRNELLRTVKELDELNPRKSYVGSDNNTSSGKSFMFLGQS